MKFFSKKILFGLLAAGVVFFGLRQGVAVTKATDDVTICHATSSNTNPYNIQHPDKSGDVSGHDGHNGGVFFAGASSWGDIIPPFDYQTNDIIGTHTECPTSASSYGVFAAGKTCTKQFGPNTKYAFPTVVNDYGLVTHHYAGKNWDQEGQAVWNNSCNIPVVDCDSDYDNNSDGDDQTCVTPTPTPVLDCDGDTDGSNPNGDDKCVTPTATPTATPTQTPSNGGGSTGGPAAGDGLSDGRSSCPECTQAPKANVQAVLGASTMAGTGTFENTVMDFMLAAGMIVLSLGGLSYAKEKKN